MEEKGSPLHFAMIGCPGVGHLTPILELAQRLLHHSTRLKVTVFIISSTSSNSNPQLQSTLLKIPSLTIHHLPPVNDVVDPSATFVAKLYAMMRDARAGFRDALVEMADQRPNVLVVDIFGLEYFDLANEFSMSKYVFVTSHAWFFCLSVYIPFLDKMVEGEYVDLDQTELLSIPGCRSVRPEDVIEPMRDRSNQQYKEYLQTGCLYPTADGYLINTWEDLEVDSLKALRDETMLGTVIKGPVYAVGPVVAGTESGWGESEVFEWLDGQRNESVLFVAFGSGGTLSARQMIELAWGLEFSEQRFIWVVRLPVTSDESTDVSHYMPDGFLNRTRKLGLVVNDWASQREILSHRSVGGFLTHCGWNSSLESIVNGVPMVAWPLYAEQRMNATMLVEEMKVAVRPATLPAEQVVVDREEVKMLITKIMSIEGNEQRGRVKELKRSAEEAVRVGGSSWAALNKMLEHCARKSK
ncbi:hypothetical protein QQ045_020902 [Rhodiola kirilowii]